MASFWDILYICFNILTVIAYLISIWFIRLHKAPGPVKAIWGLGFTYAFASLFSGYAIIHPDSYDSIWGIVAVFVTETAAGLEHWLFSLEYFASAEMISQKLNLQVERRWNLPNKQKLFWTVAFLYILLQISLCTTEGLLSI